MGLWDDIGDWLTRNAARAERLIHRLGGGNLPADNIMAYAPVAPGTERLTPEMKQAAEQYIVHSRAMYEPIHLLNQKLKNHEILTGADVAPLMGLAGRIEDLRQENAVVDGYRKRTHAGFRPNRDEEDHLDHVSQHAELLKQDPAIAPIYQALLRQTARSHAPAQSLAIEQSGPSTRPETVRAQQGLINQLG